MKNESEIWHKINVIWPRRTIEGGWTITNGQVWRRRVSGRWIYSQEPETEQEFLERTL